MLTTEEEDKREEGCSPVVVELYSDDIEYSFLISHTWPKCTCALCMVQNLCRCQNTHLLPLPLRNMCMGIGQSSSALCLLPHSFVLDNPSPAHATSPSPVQSQAQWTKPSLSVNCGRSIFWDKHQRKTREILHRTSPCTPPFLSLIKSVRTPKSRSTR